MRIAMSDFDVDLKARRVTYKSIVTFSYYRYPDENDWLKAKHANASNDYLFGGCHRDLEAAAKQAAVLAGMRHL
jgi:hypothetical protein